MTETVTASLARSFVQAVLEEGVPVRDLPAARELAAELLAAGPPRERVPWATLEAFVRALERAPGVPADLGLRVARRSVDSGAWGVVAFGARARARVGDALAHVIDHQAVINAATSTAVTLLRDRAILRDGPARGSPAWPAGFVDFALAGWVLAARRWTGHPFVPSRVRLRRPPPDDDAPWRDVFHSPLEFGAAASELHLPLALLEVPLVTSDPALQEVLDSQARAELAEVTPAVDLAAAVRAHLRRALSRGPTLTRAARALGTSPRTLQRGLAARGETFGRLLDEIRRETAMSVLRAGSAKVEALARDLGYADARSFRRAFTRWAGETPGRFKAPAAGSRPPPPSSRAGRRPRRGRAPPPR